MARKGHHHHQQNIISNNSSGSRHNQSREVGKSIKNYIHDEYASFKAKFSIDISQLRTPICVVLGIALTMTTIAFFTGNWLEVGWRYNGSRFKKLGLWRACFNSFSAPDDYEFRKFYVGCRWIFANEYKPIRRFLFPAFFVSTQVLYTIGYLIIVLICTSIISVQQCFVVEREYYALRALSVASFLSALASTSAVAIFGLHGNGENWMPDPEHNYLSWSYAAAMIGAIFQWIAAILFYTGMRLIIRRDTTGRSSQSTNRVVYV